MSAKNEYEAAVNDLLSFCDKETELEVEIINDRYPLIVVFTPKSQVSLLEQSDENGMLLVSVGLTCGVESTLAFKLEEKVLRKLIKLAAKIGIVYYHAFREDAYLDERAEQMQRKYAERSTRSN